MSRGLFSSITLEGAAKEWLKEDISSFDVGGHVAGDQVVSAIFYCKSLRPIVISGFPFVKAIFQSLGVDKLEWFVEEGQVVDAATKSSSSSLPSDKNNNKKCRVPIGMVEGPAYVLLQGERTALEVLSRSSACATYGHLCVQNARKSFPQWRGAVAATRKTTPGSFRLVEKYGAVVGGCDPHRYNLSSMVMLKDNHIDVAGSITLAVAKARTICGFSTKIEVECRSMEDALEAAGAGADVVMLDNMTPSAMLKQQVEECLRRQYPHLLIEMSGGVNADTIGTYVKEMGNAVDVVSVGLITHGPPPVDISMKVDTTSQLSRKQKTSVLSKM